MIKPIISQYLFLGLALFWTSVALSQGEWKLKQDKDGIQIYSRENPLSDFDEFRATTQLDQSVHAFISVLKDIPSIPDWMHSVKSSRLIELSGDTIQIYYTEAKAPFPLKNRDGVYLNRFEWDNANQKLTVLIEVATGYVEEDEGMVRISRGQGFWEASKNENGKLDLTFQMQVDPGGSIPAWLANMFVVDTPFQTLSKLRQLITKEKYQNTRYEFVEEDS